LPDFLGSNIPKRENNTKCPQSIPNGPKLYQTVLKYVYQHFLFQGPPKYTLIGIFGLKINHLANLAAKVIRKDGFQGSI
jgi:hypothetical protein